MIDKETLTCFLKDIRHLTLFPKRYELTHYGDENYWHKVSTDLWNFKKRVKSNAYNWYVVTYKDGRQELAYFRVWYLIIPRRGRLCRGILYPRLWGIQRHEHVKDIRLAF